MKHANRVGEARMCRTWKYEFRKSELSDASQTLERPSLDNLPKSVLELFGTELDQIVEWITDTLSFDRTGHEWGTESGLGGGEYRPTPCVTTVSRPC